MLDEDGVRVCPWCGNGPLTWPDAMFGVCECCRKDHKFNIHVVEDNRFRKAGYYCSRCLKKRD